MAGVELRERAVGTIALFLRAGRLFGGSRTGQRCGFADGEDFQRKARGFPAQAVTQAIRSDTAGSVRSGR